MRPTVFVGLGGTGLQILVEARTRLAADRRTGSLVDRLLQFVWLDTDTRVAGSQRLPGRCARSIGGFEVEQYARYACMHDPEFRRWWNCSLPSSSCFLDHGSRTIRRNGRVGLYYNLQAVSDRLQDAAAASLAASAGQEPPRCVVCTSLCGGTGGAIFVDAGYLLREVTAGQAELIGVFLLPGIYAPLAARQEVADILHANSYAAIKELCHYANAKYEFGPPGMHMSAENVEAYDAYWLIEREDVAGRIRGNVAGYSSFVAAAMIYAVLADDWLPTGFPYVVAPAPFPTVRVRDYTEWRYAYNRLRSDPGQLSPHVDRQFDV